MGKNTSKKGTEYELFVKSVYDRLLATEGLQDVNIQHDIVLHGARGDHQIDLYWEFRAAGILHRVAVECKDYKNPISIGKIRDFNDALVDIGGIKGVFATTVGFQSGALDYAKNCGISPFIIHHPTDKDWEGRIMEIALTIRVLSVVNKKLALGIEQSVADSIGIKGTTQKAVNTEDTKVRYDRMRVEINGQEVDSIFEAESSEIKTDTGVVIKGHDPLVSIDTPGEETLLSILEKSPSNEPGHIDIKISFINGYVCAGDEDSEFDNLPINEINISYDVVADEINTRIKADKEVLAVLRDLTENESRIIPFDGEIITTAENG